MTIEKKYLGYSTNYGGVTSPNTDYDKVEADVKRYANRCAKQGYTGEIGIYELVAVAEVPVPDITITKVE